MNDFLTCVIFCCQNQPFLAGKTVHSSLSLTLKPGFRNWKEKLNEFKYWNFDFMIYLYNKILTLPEECLTIFLGIVANFFHYELCIEISIEKHRLTETFCHALTLFCHAVIELHSWISIFVSLNLALFPCNPIYFVFFSRCFGFSQ